MYNGIKTTRKKKTEKAIMYYSLAIVTCVELEEELLYA
jgi:hypothetical protein